MKNKKTSVWVNEQKEVRIHPSITLARVLFRSFFWVLLIILEAYLWIFKNSEMIQWVKDLKVLWLGMGLGSIIVIGLYAWCYLQHYVVRIKRLKMPSFGSMVTIAVTVARILEVILIISHHTEFIAWCAEGFIPFTLFVWIGGMSIMTFILVNFLRTPKSSRHRRSRRRSRCSKKSRSKQSKPVPVYSGPVAYSQKA